MPNESTLSSSTHALHEEVRQFSWGKKSSNFLDDACGVGATRSRGYIQHLLVPKWCEFCGLGHYLCLGPGCKGVRHPEAPTGTKRSYCSSRSRQIPGKGFIKSSGLASSSNQSRLRISAQKFPSYFPPHMKTRNSDIRIFGETRSKHKVIFAQYLVLKITS